MPLIALRRLVFGSALLVAPALGRAQVVYDNPVNLAATDAGAFSQGSQLLAGRFSLAAASTVTGASWHGTMFAADPLNTGDIWSFNLVVRASNSGLPGSVLHSRSVMASVFETTTSISGERLYRFDATFAGFGLAAGTDYFFGAINTGTQETFRWTQGLVAAPAYYSTNGGTSWTDLEANRQPLNFSLSSSTTTVPEPSTVLLLAAAVPALAVVARRRRSR